MMEIPISDSDKNVERLQRKAILEQEKRKKPGECQKYIRAIIDENLVNETIGSKILINLATLDVKYELKKQPISRTVFWQRSQQQIFTSTGNGVRMTDNYLNEKPLIHVMAASELNTCIKNNTLLDRMEQLQQNYPNMELILLIFGLKEYCRTDRANVGRLAFETALTEIQLLANIAHRLLDTPEDVGQVLVQFSKSVAEIPYRKDRDGKLLEQNFYLVNDKKDCVQVKDNAGLSNLWQHQLCKLPMITLEAAEAIIREYPMPSKLLKAYESNDANGPLLLANIPIKRAAGPLTSSRKIGAELSRKIHALYTNINPDYTL